MKILALKRRAKKAPIVQDEEKKRLAGFGYFGEPDVIKRGIGNSLGGDLKTSLVPKSDTKNSDKPRKKKSIWNRSKLVGSSLPKPCLY